MFSRDDDDSSYEMSKTLNSINHHSVLKKVKLLRNQSKYVLAKGEELLIKKSMKNENNKISTSDEDEDEDEEEEEESPIPKTKETKRKRKKIDEGTKAEKKKKTNAGKAVASKPDKEKKEKGKKGKETKAKKEKIVKVKKPPVDKSDPNWRLKPNPIVQVWEKDPLFETKSGFKLFNFIELLKEQHNKL